MRDPVFPLEYDPDCNGVAASASATPDARIRSLPLHATGTRPLPSNWNIPTKAYRTPAPTLEQ